MDAHWFEILSSTDMADTASKPARGTSSTRLAPEAPKASQPPIDAHSPTTDPQTGKAPSGKH